MDNFSLKVAKILGTGGNNGWAQTYFFSPENKDLLEKRGSLLACFSLLGQDEINPEFGQELIDRLQKEYYDQPSGWPMARLVEALEAITKEITESQFDFAVEIVAGVFWKGVWYFAVLGEGKVLVKRGPTISAVLVGEGLGQVVSSSGKAEAGDLVILGTSSFYILRDDLIQQALGQQSLEETADKLSSGLSISSKNSDAAGLLIGLVNKKNQSETGAIILEEKQEKKSSFSTFNRFKSFPWKRWSVLAAGFTLVLALAAGGYFFFRQNNLVRQEMRQEVLSQAQDKYQEAQGLASLDKDQAIATIARAKDLLDSISFDRTSQEEADRLREELNQLLITLTQTPPEPVESLTEFFSLAQIEEGLNLASLTATGRTIYLLDNNQGKVYSLDWENRRSAVILGDEKIKKATAIFSQAGKITLLTDDGFYEINNNRLNKTIETNDSWGKIVDFSGWLGSLYLLDVQNGTIWQYPAIRAGFGAIRKWNKEDLPQLTEGAKMAIDGAIWLTGDNLYRFFQGYLEETYSVPNLGNQVLIHTAADFANVYLVDKNNSRFLSVNKETGQIGNEIKAIDLDQAKGLIISPDETVAVIGTQDKLLKVNLE